MSINKNYKIFCLTGLSGSGKTTLSNKILEKYSKRFKLSKIVTYTTRIPRPGERAGLDYNFIKKDEFEKLIEEDFFLETNNYDNNYYGTAKKDFLGLNENKILVTNFKGTIEIQKKFKNTIVFLVTCKKELLTKRLENSRLNWEKRVLQNKHDEKFTPTLSSCINLENNYPEDLEKNIKLVKSFLKLPKW